MNSGFFSGYYYGLLNKIINNLIFEILNDINDNMRSLYINLLAIKDIMGKIVPEVASITDLRKLDYNIIESLASLNIKFMQNCSHKDGENRKRANQA